MEFLRGRVLPSLGQDGFVTCFVKSIKIACKFQSAKMSKAFTRVLERVHVADAAGVGDFVCFF